MCGIAGFWATSVPREPTLELTRMAAAIRHRGPDSAGVWFDAQAGIGLAHQRLAIVDLSESGAQPMSSTSGRYVVSFNGEIYNHSELRAQLEDEFGAIKWRGSSDTETLLASIELRGLEAALQSWVGMFALALWDKRERKLHLARDRFGEKPLYYGRNGSAFFFGSELKAIVANPMFSPTVDRRALALYFRYHYIPAPYSIYENIFKLMPGSFATLSSVEAAPEIRQYWSAVEAARAANRHPFSGSMREAGDELERLLKRAIDLQVRADVPVGAFLSGGIDSSTVVALMQASDKGQVKTFTIGFGEGGFNEAPYASAVARHLGTDHHELNLSADIAQSVIPELSQIYDEPFADVSQLPTYFVSKLARSHVTVSLSGDGGDELFGGYTRYSRAAKLLGLHRRLGKAGRYAAERVLSSSLFARGPTGGYNSTSSNPQLRNLLQVLGRGSELMAQPNAASVYRGMLSFWSAPGDLVINAEEPAAQFLNPDNWLHEGSGQEAAQLVDVLTFLPDQILVKVDRAAMRVSLETRVPMLDHRVAQFVWSLPASFRANPHAQKQLLKDVLARHVPTRLTDRPKMGFGVPIADWLRGPLRDWAEGLLNEKSLADEGYLNVGAVRTAWSGFLANQGVSGAHIWSVLTFQAWLRSQQPALRSL